MIRRLYIYILAMLAVALSSCIREELVEQLPQDKPESALTGRVTIGISAMLPDNTVTKVPIDPQTDIHSLHLIVFDENGMLVEICEAETWGNTNHDDHHNGRNYKVTLTLSDEKRIIHFIANCPAPDKIVYGHEASIIGNMYVKDHATAYWARIEVPYIMVNTDSSNDGIYELVSNIKPLFNHIPLLRNYAEITISDATAKVNRDDPPVEDAFIFTGYTVYNTIDRGTVAPYNSHANPPAFQSFIDTDSTNYTYPELSALGYEGHVLASSVFLTDLPKDAYGQVIVYEPEEPFYMYERKVSVRTNEEDKWLESPPHIIIKGDYKPANSTTWSTYYYKVDLVYNVMSDPNNTPTNPNDDIISDIKYYNILRNFNYHFDIIDVHDKGYETIEEAMAGAAGNNLSGSAAASKLDNISDHVGRLWVSYTDTTLVSGEAVSLKYKYIQNAFDPASPGYNVITNDAVRLENFIGDVIYHYDIEETDIMTGQWAGYRNIILYINEPSVDSYYQAVRLKTNSANLNREIRYYLKKRFTMEVECTPKVKPDFGESVDVKIKLPRGLTEDMFPLELKIEVRDKTLSPDVSENEYELPVKTAVSIIPNINERSFHYLLTIPDRQTYMDFQDEGVMKVLPTYWLTNLEDNESTVYVDNKYFAIASDSWGNYIYEFTDPSLSLTNLPYGIGRELTLSYTLDGTDNDRLSRDITLILKGLSHPGAEVDENGNIILTVRANADSQYVSLNGNRVTVSGLITTSETDPVSIYIEADDYLDESVDAIRSGNEFTDLVFNPGTLAVGPDIPVTFSFNLPAYYEDMVVNVEIDGLVPADDETSLAEVDGRSTIRTYTYCPTEEGIQTFRLKTINNEPCTCIISLDTPDEYYYAPATHSVSQSPVSYHFNARFGDGTPEKINANSEVKVVFDIKENDGYEEGMIVYVTLDRFEPKDTQQNLQGIGNNVYQYRVNGPGIQEFVLKPSEMSAGTCSVVFEADKFVPDPLYIDQTWMTTQIFSTDFNNNSTNGWGAWQPTVSSWGVSNGELWVTTSRLDDDKDQGQVARTSGVNFKNGKTYILKFKVWATATGKIYPYMQYANDSASRWDPVGDFPVVEITKTGEANEIAVELQADCEADGNRLIFAIGQISGTIHFDDIEILEVQK